MLHKFTEPEKEKSIAAICTQYQQPDFMNNNHCRSNITAPQKSHNHKNICAKIFQEVAQQTDESRTEHLPRSPDVQKDVRVTTSRNNKCSEIDEDEPQKSHNQDTMCSNKFHEVAQQTDENKAEEYQRRSPEIRENVYVTEDGCRSPPLQIIESYGNVNEAEIHGAIDNACNGSIINANTEIESLREQNEEDNHCQTESKINQEENVDGEMKEDVVNVLIEVENTRSIDQKISNERLSIQKGINPDTISKPELSITSEPSSKRKDCQYITQQAKFQRLDRESDISHDETCQINNNDELLKIGNIVAVRPYSKRDYKPGRPWIASLKEIGTRNVKVVWLSGTYDTKWIEDPQYFPHSIPRQQVECSFV
ncbi:unnamed protein product [Mytilus coruscus]|uniref:Uncharacterized protein n=1 Tax=Mytilus coruscus TaxID=42192 RepID=A0A6J8CM43_MYTCO|nr:unnamed protein product [Mytilus coruscus]